MKINIINACSDLGVNVDGSRYSPIKVKEYLKNNENINKIIDVFAEDVVKSNDKNDLEKNIEPLNRFNDKLYSILKNAAISVEQVDKFVVVKTLTGAASAAAEAIDSLYTNDVAGTIAGDNTIFVLVRSDEKAVELISKIRKMIS